MQCDDPVAHAPEPDTHALPAPAISCSRAISANASVPMAPLRKPGKGVGGGGDGGPQPGDGEGGGRVPAADLAGLLQLLHLGFEDPAGADGGGLL